MRRLPVFPRSRPAVRLAALSLSVGLGLACEPGVPVENQLPETRMSVDRIDLSGPDRLNSVVKLAWFGSDADGYVVAYELRVGEGPWVRTTQTDSTLVLGIPAGQDTADLAVEVRAIDHEGGIDPSPARLVVPIKNTPPSAEFTTSSFPDVPVWNAVTFQWFAEDPDGAGSITDVELRVNGGAWRPIDPNQKLVSLVLHASGATALYYGNQEASAANWGYALDTAGPSLLEIRARDLAGAWSAPDTAPSVTVKMPQSKLLVVASHSAAADAAWSSDLAALGVDYDLLDLLSNSGAARPRSWNPGFRHTLRGYDAVVVYTASSVMLDPQTGLTKLPLAHMGPAIQRFGEAGGRVLVSASFSATSDLTDLVGTFPIDGLVTSTGQVRLVTDSALVAQQSGYPNLKSTNVLIGLTPMVASADAEVLYRGQLSKLSGWQGDNLMGVLRRKQGAVQSVFLSFDLHRLDGQNGQMRRDALQKILIDEFGL
ncbi:MAG: hypothetical protein ACKOW0_06035 [Schleiferiaceae bacterium]